MGSHVHQSFWEKILNTRLRIVHSSRLITEARSETPQLWTSCEGQAITTLTWFELDEVPR